MAPAIGPGLPFHSPGYQSARTRGSTWSSEETVITNYTFKEITTMATATALLNKATSESKRKNSATAASEPDHVAELAYTLWESRGCPIGSPEEDWFKAEQELAATAGSANDR